MIVFKTFDEMGPSLLKKTIGGNVRDKPKNTKKNQFIVLNKVEGPNCRYLTLPIHRFEHNYKIIILDNEEYTYCRLMMVIYDFYNNKELTYEDLKNINEDDVYDYVTDLVKLKKENPNQKVFYSDVLAGKKYMENIFVNTDKAGDTQYYLSLGS
jgi:hypothetical protein